MGNLRTSMFSEEGSFEEFLLLEFRALWDLAYLACGDRTRARDPVLDALLDARASWSDIRDRERPGVAVRGRLVRRLRRMGPPAGDEPLWRALEVCGKAERLALIFRVHERMPDAETAAVLARDPLGIDGLVSQGLADVRAVLAQEAGPVAHAEGWLRLEMQRAAAVTPDGADPFEMLEGRRRGRVRRGALIAGLLASLTVVVVAGAAITGSMAGREPRQPAEAVPRIDERAGYRLVVADGWRPLPTLADPRRPGAFDPSRFGLVGVDASDEVGAYIPEDASSGSALLTISITPNQGYGADVARIRDEIAAEQVREGTVVTAAIGAIAGRPATRFRIDHPTTSLTCSGCRQFVWVIHWVHGNTLTVRLKAFGGRPFERYGPEAEEMVESLAPVWDADVASYSPQSGSVREDVEFDAVTEAVALFMDARMRGREAEEWMTAEAAEMYRREGGMPLYARPGARYRVIARTLEPDGTVAFLVDLLEQADARAEPVGTRRERLVVGSGRNVYGQPWPEAIVWAEVVRG